MGYWDGHSEGMSSAFHVAKIVEDRLEREMHQNAAEWEQYANGLKDKLVEAEALRTLATGKANGRGDVIAALQEALRAKDPDNPLLAKDVVRRYEDRELSEYAPKKGFIYNPQTRSVRRA